MGTHFRFYVLFLLKPSKNFPFSLCYSILVFDWINFFPVQRIQIFFLHLNLMFMLTLPSLVCEGGRYCFIQFNSQLKYNWKLGKNWNHPRNPWCNQLNYTKKACKKHYCESKIMRTQFIHCILFLSAATVRFYFIFNNTMRNKRQGKDRVDIFFTKITTDILNEAKEIFFQLKIPKHYSKKMGN